MRLGGWGFNQSRPDLELNCLPVTLELFSNFLYSFAKVKLEMDSEIFNICNKILRSEQIILKDVEHVDQRGPPAK